MAANARKTERRDPTKELRRVQTSAPGQKGPRAITKASATAAAGADLSHIAEQLRPLAVPCSELILDPSNARRHPEVNLEALKGSLRIYGQRKPVVVNRRSRTIEAGNGTLQAGLALGWSHLAVVYVDDDPMTAAGFSIADNRTAELAEWDRAALDKLLREIRTNDPVLDQMLADLGASLGEVREGQTDPDEVPEPPDEPLTRPGDLWLLGGHRLCCGDAGKAEDVDCLLDGSSIELVNSDPPYNVRLEPRSNNAIAAGLSSFEAEPHSSKGACASSEAKRTRRKLRARDRPLINDYVCVAEYERLLATWFGNMARVLEPGRGFYLWGGFSNCANYPHALAACGLYFSQAIIWVKEHAVLTRKDYMGNHEWCFYGWREGAAHRFFGPNNVSDVWSVKKISPQSMLHLTEKPTELAMRALQYSSRPGENVLDLFGGSGSTLIAAEQTGRRALLMEIDPWYCDVIIKRWENFTGGKAQRQAAAT
jgi:DNA modification methylase